MALRPAPFPPPGSRRARLSTIFLKATGWPGAPTRRETNCPRRRRRRGAPNPRKGAGALPGLVLVERLELLLLVGPKLVPLRANTRRPQLCRARHTLAARHH